MTADPFTFSIPCRLHRLERIVPGESYGMYDTTRARLRVDGERGELVVEATCGRSLAIVPLRPDTPLTPEVAAALPKVLWLDREALEHINRPSAHSTAKVTLAPDGTLRVDNGRSVLIDAQEDRKFPDIEGLVQGEADAEYVTRVTLNADLLARLANALGSYGPVTLEIPAAGADPKKVRPIRVRPAASGDSVYEDEVNGRSVGYIMPLTRDDPEEAQ